MSSHTLKSWNFDLEQDHTQFSRSELDYWEQEQFECPSTLNLRVGHEHDASEIHSPKVDRIQTPADRHGEKEISCEGDFKKWLWRGLQVDPKQTHSYKKY
jgi:hypothetical protein